MSRYMFMMAMNLRLAFGQWFHAPKGGRFGSWAISHVFLLFAIFLLPSFLWSRAQAKQSSTASGEETLPFPSLFSLVFHVMAAASLALPVVAGVSLAFQPSWAVKWAQKRWPRVLFFRRTQDQVVALTIDDGPHPDITPELLRILKENDCRATWFIIGSNMEECPDLVEQIHSEGHEVGNHTMYDAPSWRLPAEELEKQLLAVDAQLADLYFKDSTNRKIKWFRPGHGLFTKKMLEIVEAHGYRTALGSLFPLDTLFTNQGEKIAKYLQWRVHNGAIIILHDRGPQKLQTAKVLRHLLPNLRKRGFSVVTLSELQKLKAN